MSENKEQGLRYNSGKPKLSYIDFGSFEEMTKVLEFGAKKYSRNNWKKGFPVTELCDSLLRHIAAILNGEDIDKESGLPHYAHAQCNTMFLAHTLKYHPEFDDRVNEIKKEEK